MRAIDLLRPPLLVNKRKYQFSDFLKVLGVIVILLLIPITAVSTSKSRGLPSQAKIVKVSDEKTVEKQTLNILNLSSKFKTAKDKQQLQQQITNIINSRQEKLSDLAEENPSQVLKVSLPEKLRQSLPATIQNKIEKSVVKEGSLEVFVEEDFQRRKTKYRHFLQTKSDRFELYSPEKFPELVSGTRVKISGVQVGNKIVIDRDIEKDLKVLGTEVFGDQKVLILLVNFQDDARQPISTATVQNLMLNTVNGWYREVSFGKVSLSGAAFGWYTLPYNFSTTTPSCDIEKLQQEAIQAANADVNFTQFSRLFFVFPDLNNRCPWSGTGSVGSRVVSTPDGVINASSSWVKYQSFNLGVVAHEMGHNFGLFHANAWECGSQPIGQNCNSVEYGNPYDIMGNSGSYGHFNAHYKEKLGWFSPANVQTVSANATVSINPLENPSSGVQAVKVLLDNDGTFSHYYFAEFRRPVGYDAGFSPANYDGVFINYAPIRNSNPLYSQSHLVDTTPGSQTSAFNDNVDSALKNGQTFTDSIFGVNITTTNVTSTNLTLKFDFGTPTCTHQSPTIQIAPANVFKAPGESATYTVQVTNNDSSACNPVTFNLTRAVPSGWAGNFTNSNLTISPGSTSSTSLNITSPTNAEMGFYNISVIATNSSNSSFADTGIVSYTVLDVVPPTVSLTSPSNGATVSESINIAASAFDNVGISKVEFFVDGILVGTDTTSPYSLNWNTTSVSNGSHSLLAKAYDNAGNIGDSQTVTVSVNNQSSGLVSGDLNSDGVVNVLDLSILLVNWRTNDPNSDLNDDGTVNVLDLSIMLTNWG